MAGREKQNRTPPECPVCGAIVPPKALACPECGADEHAGWNEDDIRYDALDLPDGSFDDDAALKDEGTRRRISPKGASIFWRIVGIGMAVVLIYFVVKAAF